MHTLIQKFLCGDALELLHHIPNESIDVVITDPPYDINIDEWDIIHKNKNSAFGGKSPAQKQSSFKRRGKPIRGWSKEDREAPVQYQEWCQKWLKELNRVVKPASPILIFNSRRLLHRLTIAAENEGFIVKDILIWKKSRANGKAQNVNKIPAIKNSGLVFYNYRVGNLTPFYEPILFCIKSYPNTLAEEIIKSGNGGFYSPENNIKSNIFDYSNEKATIHPTQKPLDLIENLIETFSSKGHVILDCFAGVGTTCLAAKNLQRQFIGIEKNEIFYNNATKRLDYIEDNQML